jgi:hypothetical protein
MLASRKQANKKPLSSFTLDADEGGDEAINPETQRRGIDGQPQYRLTLFYS